MSISGGGINYIFLLPQDGNTHLDQLINCISQLDDVDNRTLIKTTLFINVAGNEEYSERKQELLNWLNDHAPYLNPLVTVVAQPPEDGHLVAVEIVEFEKGDYSSEVRQIDGVTYRVMKYPTHEAVYGAGFCGNINDSVEQQSDEAFQKFEKVLNAEGITFGDVVRQWNYIEDILDVNSCQQHYQVFNDVRTRYYDKSPFPVGFPAATGIGQDVGGVVIDFIAVKSPKQKMVFPIQNPEQIDAHAYSRDLLVGEETQKTRPKFERAKLVKTPLGNRVFISGTAAIKGEFTIPEMDYALQTNTTLDNILKLVEPERFIDALENNETPQKGGFASFRAYVKEASAISKVEEICTKRFPDTPLLCVVADVCRDNLIVEIEGEYVFD